MDSDELRAYFATRSGGLSTYQKRELKKLLEIAIARAEVAEARADALEDANAVLSDALESTRRKLEKMTAAFTALQAAGEWLSPDTARESGPVQIILNAQAVDFFFYAPDESGRMIFENSIVAWRPTPPARGGEGE